MPGIGIAISPHFKNNNFSFARYWATLISATVDATDETHLLLTFAASNPNVTYSDFTISGVTINSGSWAGSVLTLVLSAPLYVSKTITFVKSGGTHLVQAQRFVMSVNTALSGSAGDTFVLPCYGGGYDAYVDWGDGGAEQKITASPGNVSHQYASAGIYQVSIRGTFPTIRFNNGGDKLKLLDILSWGNIAWGSFESAFYGCANLTGTYIDYPKMSAVTSCYAMFFDCRKNNGILTNWDTSNVTTMFGMFFQNYLFKQPVSGLDTGKVTTMVYMLANCSSFNQSLAGFDIRSVTTMDSILSGSAKFSRSNYDATLISFAAQNVKSNVIFSNIAAKYGHGAATTARGVLTGKGWTITDAGQTSFAKGQLVLSADDGYKSFYSSYYPLCVSKNVKATVYVIGAAIGLPVTFLNWTEIAELIAAGFDVQCHTNNHYHLGTLNEAQVLAEYTDLDDAFTAQSLATPRHTAYPFGESTANVKTWTATLRDTARGTAEGLVELNTDKFDLPAYSISSTAEAAMTRVGGLLDNAQEKLSGIILYTHEVDTVGQISSAQLGAIIDYAKSLGMDIITISELYAKL